MSTYQKFKSYLEETKYDNDRETDGDHLLFRHCEWEAFVYGWNFALLAEDIHKCFDSYLAASSAKYNRHKHNEGYYYAEEEWEAFQAGWKKRIEIRKNMIDKLLMD